MSEEELEVVSETTQEVTETSEPEIKEEESGTSEEPEAPKDTGVQKRFNKLTAEKYAEKRRADALEKQLAEAQAVPVSIGEEAPTLEKFDYDDAKFNEASIKYHVGQAVAKSNAEQTERNIQTDRDRVNQEFARKIEASGIEDYGTVIQTLITSVPLPEGLITAIQADDKGPELAYYLGNHLDVADKLAAMSVISAALELGKISAGLSGKKTKTPSNAPTPVKTIGGGGGTNKEPGEMTMEDIYNIP